jgi:hypothetical protein
MISTAPKQQLKEEAKLETIKHYVRNEHQSAKKILMFDLLLNRAIV